MSATEIRMQFTAVVDKMEHLPPWLLALCEETGKSDDELVRTMLYGEMYRAGEKFMEKFPELFRSGIGLV